MRALVRSGDRGRVGGRRVDRNVKRRGLRIRRLVLLLALALVLPVAYQLTPAAPPSVPPEADEGFVDMHVHVGCVGTGGSGCFVSPALSESYKFPFYLRAFGVTEEELEREGDTLVLDRLSEAIGASKRVNKAVVLALDGVIDDTGKLDRERTQVYVPNEYLAREIPRYDNLLFGASVNPYRPDALERLEWVKRHGAVLVKWIPAIMDIDPLDETLVPFYRKLVALELPLLTHAGQERSFAHARDELGDPLRLELPLRLGVTVIAAHIATTGENGGEANFDRIMPLFSKYPKLYADISSLTQINKLGYLRRALEREEVVPRLVYGSDWPLQFFPLVSVWYQLGRVPFAELKAIRGISNQWDRDVALKQAMGVPTSVFTRGAELLR